MSLPDRILLIDEPEAFLHPTLARRLGRVLAETARDRGASMVVATHSSEFLLGCMQMAPDLRIVRLGYEGGVSSARSIDATGVQALVSDPLLRSAHAMRALFHRAVLICEADADRAFYEEINTRLTSDRRGIEDALFMNAQNWQTVPRLAVPLRKLGIPAAAIFDFDVLMDDSFGHIWPMLHENKDVLRPIQRSRDSLKLAMISAGRPACKAKGLDALPSTSRSAARRLLSTFASYGIFFVPVGELECWISELFEPGGNKRKSDWLIEAFRLMGSDPTNANYVSANRHDVWEFIAGMRLWIDDPDRKGVPV